MSYYKNLIPGQWQIGDIVFGKGTNIKIETVDVKPYDVNAQDYQVARADESRFGFDSFKPSTIEITMDVLTSYMLPGHEGDIPNFWHSMPDIHDLQREWRGDEVRNTWGQMKPLYVCSKLDGLEKIVMGRPGQFKYTMDQEYNHGEVMNVVAEFRRGDTLSYSVEESAIFMDSTHLISSINGTSGNGPSWLRLFIGGPINHPKITLTNMHNMATPVIIELDYNIPVDQIVEVNSEPWSRRVVTNQDPPINLAAKVIGDTPYLDRLRFDFNADVGITIEGASMTTETGIVLTWRDAYQVI